MTPDFRLTDLEQTRVTEAIHTAERLTSGEIRLFIDRDCQGDVLDRAAFVFKELHMHETAERNGVLIYLAVRSHKFAIIGDSGIHQKVGDSFWSDIRSAMQHRFVTGDFATGLTEGILTCGEALSRYFPRNDGDVNELSDEIVYGDPKQ